jgi:hypothetical protein
MGYIDIGALHLSQLRSIRMKQPIDIMWPGIMDYSDPVVDP